VVRILAHRGASRVARENTLEAFCEARRLWADGVELDARASADGALVVHHDAEIPGIGVIATLRVADLPPHVPLLDAALDACGDLMIDVELKDLPGEPGYDAAYPVPRLVARLLGERGLLGRTVVSSFDLMALAAALEVEPGLTTGWLTPRWFHPPTALETLRNLGHRAWHPEHDAVTEELVAQAHEAGLEVTTWTVDDPDAIRQVARAGVDGVITNVPDLARAALATE
jgi:glycerophosphoryl diester phosphodiesterase